MLLWTDVVAGENDHTADWGPVRARIVDHLCVQRHPSSNDVSHTTPNAFHNRRRRAIWLIMTEPRMRLRQKGQQFPTPDCEYLSRIYFTFT